MRRERSREALREGLRAVTELLDKQEVLDALAHRQEGPKRELLEELQHRQSLAALRHRVRDLHPADLAYIVEALPATRRVLVFRQLDPRRQADVLLELGDAERGGLMGLLSRDELFAAVREMDADDLAWVADALPDELRPEVYASLDHASAARLLSAHAYADGTVGALMEEAPATVRDDATLADVLATLRSRPALPAQTDAVFVVDGRGLFKGVLRLAALVQGDPSARVGDELSPCSVSFDPGDPARDAAQAFERYDLVSAPVVDERGKLVGRIAVDAVLDFLRDSAEREALQRAGLAGDEDLFAGLVESARNRWPWLAINLVTAFFASRVIGAFSGTIERLVALASLMPIVASVGGNTGNQTVALIVRALALDQVREGTVRHMLFKESRIALLNGAVWGGLMGLFALLLYGSPALGLVMAAAMTLNMGVAAVGGVLAPLALARAGRDPAQGSSVLLTFATDAMGFFIFLGLAAVFLG